MRNSLATGWGVALFTVLLQLAVTLIVALLLLGSGATMAYGALVGGGVIASGNLLFAWRLFGRRVKPAGSALGAALLGQLLRWIWIGGGLLLAMSSALFAPIGVLAGAAAALLAQLGGLLFKH